MRLRLSPRHIVLVAMISLLGLVSCVSNPRPEALIYEGPRSAVYLEAISPHSAHADHPFTIDSPTLTLVLSALYIEDEERLLQTLVAGKAKPVRVFSDEEVRLLTPFLMTALSKTSPRQQVGFHVIHPAAPGQEMTKASVFASGPSLYLTLNQYRDNPDRLPSSEASGRRLPDRTGLTHRTILFLPAAAGIVDTEQQLAQRGSSPITLVVNYKLIQKVSQTPNSRVPVSAVDTVNTESLPSAELPINARPPDLMTEPASKKPTPTGAVGSEGPASQQLYSLKELIVQKDLEIEALKRELRELRRQLTKQQTESKSAEKRTRKKNGTNGRP